MTTSNWNRRDVLLAAGALGLTPWSAMGEERLMHGRPIPSTGERLPAIGLGTYSVFDVDSSADEIAKRKEIVDLLTGEGGSVIDTSPMYNRSEKIIGDVIEAGAPRKALFVADQGLDRRARRGYRTDATLSGSHADRGHRSHAGAQPA